jgi:peptidyl-prolyl cis-trans isomerase A (cyclophilin A)
MNKENEETVMAVTPDTPAPAVNVPGEGTLRATIVTTMGNIDIELFENEAPRTVANFVALATGAVEWTDKGQKTSRPLYQDLTIHRVIPEFMIQLGCPLGNGTGGPGYRFGDEIHPKLKHDKPGVLSMANAGPGTNGSQFFLTEVPTPWLDGKHAVFGAVTKGMDIAKAIARVPRDGRDKPNTPVILKEIKVYRA